MMCPDCPRQSCGTMVTRLRCCINESGATISPVENKPRPAILSRKDRRALEANRRKDGSRKPKRRPF